MTDTLNPGGAMQAAPATYHSAPMQQAPAQPATAPTGRIVNPQTGRPAYTGPEGQPGYGAPQPGQNLTSYTMPDGTQVWYDPNAAPDSGNLAALQAYQGTGPNGPTAQADALQTALSLLAGYGVTGADATTLANWMWQQHVQGYSDTSIAQLLLTQPIIQQHFPEIAARQKAGLPPISPGDIVSYKNQVAQYAAQYGIPQDFVKQFQSQWITNDVSMAEVGQRMQDYAQAAYQSNPAVLEQLQKLYGVTPGELTAFFADPTTALPIIQQRFQASQIAGQGQIAGYGQLTEQQAATLAQQGVTQAQAQSGFQQLGLEQQLFNPLPGQVGQTPITQEQQLGAQFLGNAADVRMVQLEALRRQAAFQGGGQYAGGQKGLSGLGTEQGAQA